jgi:hypothetical protein
VGLGLAGFAVYSAFFSQKSVSISTSSEPAPTPTDATPSAIPTPSEIKKADLKIQVLNGSGIPGKASQVAAFLVGKGYAQPDTGNADSYDYTTTELSAKKDHQDILDLLTSDLSKDYTLSEQSSVLDADSSYDAVIVVGLN